MIILKNILVFDLDPDHLFGRYNILIKENRITDIVLGENLDEKIRAWQTSYPEAEFVDCTYKLMLPPVYNLCHRSEGSLLHYLLRNRHYENLVSDVHTDLVFNYIYQEYLSDEAKEDLSNVYHYALGRSLKSGVVGVNEVSLRNDINHLEFISQYKKKTSQSISVSYPIKQEPEQLAAYSSLSPSYYLTDENMLTVLDLNQITELRQKGIGKIFLEVATNKEVTEDFKRRFNKTVLKTLDEFSLIDENCLLINPLYLTGEELNIVQQKNASVVICPRDLSYFTNRYFQIDDFIDLGINFSVATGWLGEDIFKDLRLFKNKYKELNLPSVELLKSIMTFPRKFFNDENDGSYFGVNKEATFIIAGLSDLRFQFLPENLSYDSICEFVLDNLNSSDISDVVIHGEFKVKDNKLLCINEESLISSSLKSRERLYKTAKYNYSAPKKKDKEKPAFKIPVQAADENILFNEADKEADKYSDKDVIEEFRIKSKMPVLRKKKIPLQDTLFDEFDSKGMKSFEEHLETPSLNLLYTEFEETKLVQEEILSSKVDADRLIKNIRFEKKAETKKGNASEKKVELPKDVKLRFGDD